MAETIDSVLQNFIENLDSVTTQMKDGETEGAKDANFEIKEYWDNIGSVFKMMSHEATKFSLAFSSTRPSLEACKSLVESVEKTTLTLISLYYTLPKSCGIRLRKSLKSAVCDIVDGMKSVAETIKEIGSGTQEQLQSVGTVWEGADVFKNLPGDNKEAVLNEVRQSAELVKDALDELEEAINNGGQDADWSDVFGDEEEEPISSRETWSEMDKKLLGPCVGLIKTSKSLLKKTISSIKSNGRCDIQEEITQFDTLADYTDRLSPHVDDFALSLYPPVKYDAVQENKTEQPLERKKIILEGFEIVDKDHHFLVFCDGEFLEEQIIAKFSVVSERYGDVDLNIVLPLEVTVSIHWINDELFNLNQYIPIVNTHFKKIMALKLQSHITSEDDQKWVEFLLKVNQHNWDKIKQCIDDTVT